MTLNAGAITPDKDNQLSPADWKRMLEENPDACRSIFGIDLSRTPGNLRTPSFATSKFPRAAFTSIVCKAEGQDGADVLHGGIRCEAISAFPRQRIQNVFQLHGGIAAYPVWERTLAGSVSS